MTSTSRRTWLWLSSASRWNSSTCRSRSRAAKQAGDVLGFPDPEHRRALLAGQPGAQLEGGEQPGRLGGPDPVGPEQLGPRPPGQPPERPVRDLQKLAGNLQDVRAASTRP